MIKISKKEQLLKNLEELEKDLEAGKIPKKQYESLKKQHNNRIETLEAAERIKRMQGRGSSEKSLDHWVTKNKSAKDEKEQEQLIKKYVTIPKPSKNQNKSKKSTIPKIGILAGVLLAIAFFVGTGFGVFMFNGEAAVDEGMVLVNETAFPLVENLTTNTTVKDTESKTSDSNKTEDNNGGKSNKTIPIEPKKPIEPVKPKPEPTPPEEEP
jgi:hypothetical protein